MIKTIISDYDGVLFPDEYRGARCFCPDEKTLELLENPYYARPTCEGLWDELRQRFGSHYTNEAFFRLYNHEEPDQLAHETSLLTIYQTLKQQLAHLFLLSDQIADRTRFLKQKSALTIFDQLYFSSDIGLQKPHHEIFEHIITEHNLIPGETLFIDDTLENISAAHNLGFQTHHFQDISHLEEALAQLGFETANPSPLSKHQA